MSTLAALLVLTAATPTSGVVLSKTMSSDVAGSLPLADLVRRQLDVAGLVGPEDATRCAAKAPCLTELAAARGWLSVVSVETATVLDEVLVSVRVYAPNNTTPLAQARVQAPSAGLDGVLRAALAPVAARVQQLHASAAEALAAKEAEAKAKADAEAAAAAKARAPIRRAPPAWEPAVRWLPVGVAALVLAAGGVALGLSEGRAATLRGGTLLTEADVTRTAAEGRTLQVLGATGLAVGGAGLVAGVLFAVLWKGAAPAVVVAPTPRGGQLVFVGRW